MFGNITFPQVTVLYLLKLGERLDEVFFKLDVRVSSPNLSMPVLFESFFVISFDIFVIPHEQFFTSVRFVNRINFILFVCWMWMVRWAVPHRCVIRVLCNTNHLVNIPNFLKTSSLRRKRVITREWFQRLLRRSLVLLARLEVLTRSVVPRPLQTQQVRLVPMSVLSLSVKLLVFRF